MKCLKPYLILAPILLSTACKTTNESQLLQQGVENGNGGDLIVCEQPQPSMNNQTHMLVDYFDVISPKRVLNEYKLTAQKVDFSTIIKALKQKFGSEFFQTSSQGQAIETDVNIIDAEKSHPFGEQQLQIAVEGAQKVVEKLKHVDPYLYRSYSSLLKNFVQSTRIAYNQYIDNQPDLGLLPFIPGGCEPVQIAAYFPSEFSRNYIIKQELWDKIDWTNRIGLVLHEVIYRAAREMVNHKTSRLVRTFNYLLSSESLDKRSIQSKDFGDYTQDPQFITLMRKSLKLHREDFYPVPFGNFYVEAGTLISKENYYEAKIPQAEDNEFSVLTEDYSQLFLDSPWTTDNGRYPGLEIKLNSSGLVRIGHQAYDMDRTIRFNKDFKLIYIENGLLRFQEGNTYFSPFISKIKFTPTKVIESFTVIFNREASPDLSDPEQKKDLEQVLKALNAELNRFKIISYDKADNRVLVTFQSK